LEEIILDKDKDATLKFLEEYIYRPIKKRKETHCKSRYNKKLWIEAEKEHILL
jgi:hypothetical protein